MAHKQHASDEKQGNPPDKILSNLIAMAFHKFQIKKLKEKNNS